MNNLCIHNWQFSSDQEDDDGEFVVFDCTKCDAVKEESRP